MDLSELEEIVYNDLGPGDNVLLSGSPLFTDPNKTDGKLKVFGFSMLLWSMLNLRTSITFRRNTYRGYNLGSVVTDEQWAAIKDGTFNNMFIGDSWNIGGRIYRIVDFDYFLGIGEGTVQNGTRVGPHHVVIVPDMPISSSFIPMITSDQKGTGYIGSKFRKETLPNVIHPVIKAAFGENHLLHLRRKFVNAVDDTGYPTGSAFVDSVTDLMSASMVVGQTDQRRNGKDENSRPLKLFELNPRWSFIGGAATWLCDCGISKGEFLATSGNGPFTESADGLNTIYYRDRVVFAIYSE